MPGTGNALAGSSNQLPVPAADERWRLENGFCEEQEVNDTLEFFKQKCCPFFHKVNSFEATKPLSPNSRVGASPIGAWSLAISLWTLIYL